MPRLLAPFQPIPNDTARAVSAVYGDGNLYRAVGDQVNRLFADINLADLDASSGESPEYTPVLAMLTVFQYAEDLPDHRAVDALRTRMDWKYAMHLPLNNTALDFHKLCKFRSYAMHSTRASSALQVLVNGLDEIGLFWNKSGEKINAGDILVRVCFISRVEDVMEAILLALESLAAYEPELLRENASPHWYVRYDQRNRPFQVPESQQAQQELVQTIGEDIVLMLHFMNCKECLDPHLQPDLNKLQQMLSIHYENRTGNTLWRPLECAFCGQDPY